MATPTFQCLSTHADSSPSSTNHSNLRHRPTFASPPTNVGSSPPSPSHPPPSKRRSVVEISPQPLSQQIRRILHPVNFVQPMSENAVIPCSVAQRPVGVQTPFPRPLLASSRVYTTYVSKTNAITQNIHPTRLPSIVTTNGHVDPQLDRTIDFLRHSNVGVVIRDESYLNMKLKEANTRKIAAMPIGKGKEKLNYCLAPTMAKKQNVKTNITKSRKSQGKENHESTALVESNIKSAAKVTALQSPTRQSEMFTIGSKQLGQRIRRDNEKFGKFSQPRFFPGLTPRRAQRGRVDLENKLLERRARFACPMSSSVPTPTIPKQSFLPLDKLPLLMNDSLLCRSLAVDLLEACFEEPTQSLSGTNQCSPMTPPVVLSSFDRTLPKEISGKVDESNLFSVPITSCDPTYIGSNDECCIVCEPLSIGVEIPIDINLGRHFLENMNVKCPYCAALHWMDEKLSNSSLIRPLFGICCLQGKVNLPPLLTPPPELKALYDGNDEQSESFRRQSRQYNAVNAFTSLGVQMDDRVLSGRGPNSFTIHGELRHLTGALLPQSGQDAVYAQLYIYDPDPALDIRNRRNPNLRRDVLKTIQDNLLKFNAFSSKFRQAAAILEEFNLNGQNLPAYLHYLPGTDRRRYNAPTSGDVALILPGDGTQISGMRDIIIRLRGTNELMQINECHPAYLPLHYVLLFPYGELGWAPEYRQWDVTNAKNTSTRLTQLQFYSYRLFERNSEYSTILRGGKLFQEFIVDAWAATEQNRLTFVKLNQGKLRSELYQGLTDFAADGFQPDQVGKRVILPSSFAGSARNMFEIFQDSMAITRFNQHPDIFLTMTANPNWPEITSALLPHQHVTDRPDLVARVFELKKKALMKEINRKKVFGKIVGHVFTIEFQKRGLPHIHLLIFLDGPDKIRTCAQVNKVVTAEFPNPTDDPTLFQTIKSCMIHGPCGDRNPKAPCMENGKCTKGYPREFSEETKMDQDGYPIYRRRDDGRSYTIKGKEVDNRDVVPYNPYLSKMFNCHINVEVCAGIRAVKYIHKYIFKGYDRTTIVLGGCGVDEIKQYLDARYIGPPEAAWRLFGHQMHEEIPSVVRLALHLPGDHHVLYNPSDLMSNILDKAKNHMTTLTGFFACCSENEFARSLTYQEFPQHFVWNKDLRKWTQRKRGYAIGRMYFANPNEGERFYLRLLLTVVKGPRSFECLRTVNNVLHPTFKASCIARGLLEDDQEWVHCLEEASVMKTGYPLRRLFSIILTQCSPIQPDALWNQFWVHICDHLPHQIRTMYHIQKPTDSQVQDYGLYLLNSLLQESGKSMADFPPMPISTGNWSMAVGNKLIWEHRQLQYDAEQANIQFNVERLNEGQRSAYNAITSSVLDDQGTIFFLSGGAGTGKTFLYNTIATFCRSLGHIVISVASSGIASLLLIGGRTAHSTFSIPLDVLENSVCGFTEQSLQAELFREAKLIIWDEVPMQHMFCVEAVNRSLQDIRNNSKPFGGITVVLGGDFRQILPFIRKGLREQIVAASLRRSILWKHVWLLILDVNMRLNEENTEFSTFLTEIGSNPHENIQIPGTVKRCKSIQELISTVYPCLNVGSMVTPEFLNERTILSARNDDVSAINCAALSIFPGEIVEYLAADKMSEDDAINRTITNRFPNEFLNSLNPPGLPAFKLEVKVGCPIMLLRNIAPKDGLCNGTRLIVVKCADHVIEVKILTGDKYENSAFIPRISLTPSSAELPIKMTRRQFPVRLAYAMTMNKSQGQSVNYVGIDLRTPVFSHGQLYVALSRCTSAERICVLLADGGLNTTTNIVYPEVLL